MSGNQVVDASALVRPETWQDPYPIFRQLQQYAPVCLTEAMGGWLLTRYDDVSAALRDPRLSSRRSAAFAQRLPPASQEQVVALVRHLAGWTLFTDAPDHTRLRALINKGFSMRLVEAMRPRLQTIVDRLLDAVEARREFEVLGDLAIPLPVMVIGGMLGLPEKDYARLREWSDALAPFFSGRLDPGTISRAAASIAELDSYFAPVITARRQHPGDDLVSSLIVAEEEGGILDDQEVRSTCVMLLFAGHETTTHLIGNGLYTLLRHPEACEALIRSPGLGHSAIEEMLRYESPVQWQSRIALEDVDLHGHRIPKNGRIFLMLGAANRDPAHFAEPDRFDIARRNNKHVAFGQGPHYCVGAALGRLEALIAIQSTLARLPDLRLVDPETRWLENSVLRGLKQLRLTSDTLKADS
jgi:cytochrome P450